MRAGASYPVTRVLTQHQKRGWRPHENPGQGAQEKVRLSAISLRFTQMEVGHRKPDTEEEKLKKLMKRFGAGNRKMWREAFENKGELSATSRMSPH